MENQFKMRISRMFRSSFGSCKSKNITDVIDRPSLNLLSENENHKTHQNHQQLIDLFSPKLRPFPSVCKPRWPENFQAQQSCIVSKNFFPRKKVTTERRSLLLSAADFTEGQKCPPASPVSPLSMYTSEKFQYSEPKLKVKRNKKPNNKKVRARSRTKSCGIHEFPASSYNGLFSSDEEDNTEDDKTTLFSSRSLSSDSSGSLRRSNKGGKNPRRRRAARNGLFNISSKPLIEEPKMNDSFAVVKRSRDPYSDFRRSMVEMIIEKQIFSGKDLEDMLQCFLSLNTYHHHKIIIQVFSEIWEALFSNWS